MNGSMKPDKITIPEKLNVKIGTPEEVFWTDLKSKVENDILNMKRQIEINEQMILFANNKIEKEKEKLK